MIGPSTIVRGGEPMLKIVKLGKLATRLHEFWEQPSTFADPTLLQHDDLVCPPDCGQSLGYQDHGSRVKVPYYYYPRIRSFMADISVID
jgi:hypothetical protein